MKNIPNSREVGFFIPGLAAVLDQHAWIIAKIGIADGRFDTYVGGDPGDEKGLGLQGLKTVSNFVL